jgi:hypothetical protein
LLVNRNEIPTDTLLDRDPPVGCGPDAILFLKALYLRDHVLRTLLADGSMTPTELINVVEGLRRDGALRIVQIGDLLNGGGVKIEITSKGEAEAWIALHGGPSSTVEDWLCKHAGARS